MTPVSSQGYMTNSTRSRLFQQEHWDIRELTLRYPLYLLTLFDVQSFRAWDQAQDLNNTMSNLVVNFISSNGWLSLLLRGIVSYRTMFENLAKDFRVEPAYESNISSNCALSSYLKKPLLPEAVVFVLPHP